MLNIILPALHIYVFNGPVLTVLCSLVPGWKPSGIVFGCCSLLETKSNKWCSPVHNYFMSIKKKKKKSLGDAKIGTLSGNHLLKSLSFSAVRYTEIDLWHRIYYTIACSALTPNIKHIYPDGRGLFHNDSALTHITHGLPECFHENKTDLHHILSQLDLNSVAPTPTACSFLDWRSPSPKHQPKRRAFEIMLFYLSSAVPKKNLYHHALKQS